MSLAIVRRRNGTRRAARVGLTIVPGFVHFRYRPRASKRAGLPMYGGENVMNKNDLIVSVASTSGLSRNDTAKVVEDVFASITSALRGGNEVRLTGFGTFTVATRKASTGRNPRTGEPMAIGATSQAKFRAGKNLRDAVS